MASSLYNTGTQKRVSAEENELDITPMIDVTFLLLIFFMVTSNMEDPDAVQIPPARHGLGVATRDSTVLTIFNSDGEPEVYLSDGKKEPGSGPATMADVTNHVQQGVADGKLNVIIKADREIPSGFVEEVARAANDVDAQGGEIKFYVGVVDRTR